MTSGEILLHGKPLKKDEAMPNNWGELRNISGEVLKREEIMLKKRGLMLKRETTKADYLINPQDYVKVITNGTYAKICLVTRSRSIITPE